MLAGKKKPKSLVIVIICVLLTSAIFPGNLFAETVIEEWVARYDGPANSMDHGRAVAVDNSGNVYVAGHGLGSSSYDYATIKYDSSGNQLWVARYDGSNDFDGGCAMAVDATGNVYVTGRSIGSGTDEDYATVKYSPDGTELWVKRYNGIENDSDGALAIAVDNEGNVYVTGFSSMNPSIYPTSRLDYATIKYDTNGNVLWIATYNGPENYSDIANAIAVDSEGNVYVTGTSYSSDTDLDYATIKYDTSGNQLWIKKYNGVANKDDRPCGIAVDPEGNVYVSGGSYNGDYSTDADYATIKYSPDGTELWVSRYDSTASSDVAHDLAVDSSGNVYVTGWNIGRGSDTIKYDTDGNQVWIANASHAGRAVTLDASGNVYVTGYFNSDYYTVKYNTTGNRLWTARYDGTGNSSDFALDIALDSQGNVYITGDSVGSGTERDCTTIKYSQLPNQLPVADAGPDQALLELGTTVNLDGDQSYDLDGDTITYSWTITEVPIGSTTVLNNPTSAWPSFVADVYGDYVIELVVNDPWDSSDPDTIKVSFDNIKPVANAGDNQAVIVGDTVNLDGSGSDDINGDQLTFSWIFESVPAGSSAVLFQADTVNPSFTADQAGTYVVSLIVNDGFLDSDADTVSIEVISSYDALVQILFELIDQVNLLPEASLKNRNLKKALTNKINEVLGMVDEVLYDDAKNKLRKDILDKTNGCAEAGEPDKNDWITTCPEQGQVYPLVIQAIELLETLI